MAHLVCVQLFECGVWFLDYWFLQHFLLHCFKNSHRLLSTIQKLSLAVWWLCDLLPDMQKEKNYRTRWLDDIANSMNMNLSEFWVPYLLGLPR